MINTPLGKHLWGQGWGSVLVSIVGWPWLKSVEQGAATSITAAVSSDLEAHSGAKATTVVKSASLESNFAYKTMSCPFCSEKCDEQVGQLLQGGSGLDGGGDCCAC